MLVEPDDLTRKLVVLAVCTCTTACALFLFARANRHAWLKTAMHVWYVAMCAAGVASILTVFAYPWTSPYSTLFFNLAGQCMATTGILDVMQLRYCAPRLMTLADTNASYLRLCVAAYALDSLGFAAVFALYATTGTGFLAYRIATIAIILVELFAYSWYAPPPPFAHGHAPSANATPSPPDVLCAGCSSASLGAPRDGRSSRLASTTSPRSPAAFASCPAWFSG